MLFHSFITNPTDPFNLRLNLQCILCVFHWSLLCITGPRLPDGLWTGPLKVQAFVVLNIILYLYMQEQLFKTDTRPSLRPRRAVTDRFPCVFIYIRVCAEFRSPSHLSGLNRTSSLSGADRTESLSISGSNSQLNNSIPLQQYTPDFYVRALSDLQFVKVSRRVYYQPVLCLT